MSRERCSSTKHVGVDAGEVGTLIAVATARASRLREETKLVHTRNGSLDDEAFVAEVFAGAKSIQGSFEQALLRAPELRAMISRPTPSIGPLVKALDEVDDDECENYEEDGCDCEDPCPLDRRAIARAAADLADECSSFRLLYLAHSLPGEARSGIASGPPPGRVTHRLLDVAVRRLPATARARYREEWAAEVSDLPRRARWGYGLRLLAWARHTGQGWTWRPASGLERQQPW